MLNIVVCIKQVPSCSNLKLNKVTNTVDRDNSPFEINPFDMYAIEEAIRIRERIGGTVTVISMGIASTVSILKDSVALGADKAILINDKVFAGSDTLATAYTLSKAIEKLGNYDLVICGRQSSDGDTAQVGPELAAKLGIPHITNVIEIETLSKDLIRCKRIIEAGYQVVEMDMPALITVSKGINNPRIISLKGALRAKKTDIQVWNAYDLSCHVEQCGFKGSPTRVVKTFIPKIDKKNEIIAGTPKEQAEAIFEILKNKFPDLIGKNKKCKNEKGAVLTASKLDGAIREEDTINDSNKQGKEIWVLCELKNRKIHNVVLELIGKAKELSVAAEAKVSAVLLGSCTEEEIQSLSAYGADIIYIVQNDALNENNDELYSEVFTSLIKKYNPEIVLMGATVFGRSVAPRVASLLNTGLTADCTELDIDKNKQILLQTRPAFGGNLLATIICPDTKPQMATVRPKVMNALEPNFELKSKIIYEQIEIPLIKTRIKQVVLNTDDSTSIDESEIIVAGGRGVGENGFQMLKAFAEAIGGVVGASRAAVDSGWIDFYKQIGQTGITVRPKIYFACGISGSMQHLVGMKSSDLIISINNDPNAPIHNYSNFSIIGDVFEIIPILTEMFRKE